jgi:hypothetical protein
MLTRDQIYTMLMLRNREGNVFSVLPNELICHISNMNDGSDSDINVALRLAASGIEEDMLKLVEMVATNPRLLLQAGNVVTRGGVPVIRTTLYEFLLCEGDPVGAKRIEFGFARAFDDEERTLQFKYGKGSYPDCRDAEGDLDLTGLGFDKAIFGRGRAGRPRLVCGPRVGKHMSSKNVRLTELMQPHHREKKTARCVVC